MFKLIAVEIGELEQLLNAAINSENMPLDVNMWERLINHVEEEKEKPMVLNVQITWRLSDEHEQLIKKMNDEIKPYDAKKR